jgi:hypothetical protein
MKAATFFKTSAATLILVGSVAFPVATALSNQVGERPVFEEPASVRTTEIAPEPIRLAEVPIVADAPPSPARTYARAASISAQQPAAPPVRCRRERLETTPWRGVVFCGPDVASNAIPKTLGLFE